MEHLQDIFDWFGDLKRFKKILPDSKRFDKYYLLIFTVIIK